MISLLFIEFRWLDLIDILLVAFLIYQLYLIIKGTAAIRIFISIMFIYLLWKIVELLKMELLSEILGQFIGVGVIALIIVFQQELRRFLLLLGTTDFFEKNFIARKLFRRRASGKYRLDAESVIAACESMARSRTGALLVLGKNSNLQYYVRSGETLNAKLSAKLLESIFFKNSPLHDGAVIILDNRIKAAGCVLPMSESKNFPENLGMRHRATVGITENSDAVAIAVSEETGDMAYARAGEIFTGLDRERLKGLLSEEFS